MSMGVDYVRLGPPEDTMSMGVDYVRLGLPEDTMSMGVGVWNIFTCSLLPLIAANRSLATENRSQYKR
jgi:hypothetical protein